MHTKPLTEWKRQYLTHDPYTALHDQEVQLWTCFVEDHIGAIVRTCGGTDAHHVFQESLRVVDEGRARGVPIVQFVLPGPTECLLCDGIVSVYAAREVNTGFRHLIAPGAVVSEFPTTWPASWRFGSYNHSQKNFTVRLTDMYRLFTFLWLLIDDAID